MALLNRFEDDVDENAYVREERLSRRTATRTLLGITILLYVIYAILNPNFFQGQDMGAYNATTLAIITLLFSALVLTGTNFYLENRLFDVLLFIGAAATIAVLSLVMAGMKEDEIFAFRRMATANLNALYVYNSIIFVANFRYFLYCVSALTLVYIGYLAVNGLAAFTIVVVAANLAVYLSFSIFVNWVIDQHAREVFATGKALKLERQKSENLLYNVLPESVAKRLRSGESVAEFFANVSVIFVDIVESSALAKRLSPAELVEQLNQFFLLADECADRHGVEKVKTIGDAYLAVAGGTASGGRGADTAIRFGRDLIAKMQAQAKDTGLDVQLRIGIHSGPVVGGVVGANRLAYDYWGDTMNIANRIEHIALPNGIAVSVATRAQCDQSEKFGPAELIALKGVGEVEVYRIEL